MTQQLPAQTRANIHLTNALNAFESTRKEINAVALAQAADALRAIGQIIEYHSGADEGEEISQRQRAGLGMAIQIIGDSIGLFSERLEQSLSTHYQSTDTHIMHACDVLNHQGNKEPALETQ